MFEDYFRQYGFIAIFTVIAIIVPVSMIVLSWLLGVVKVRPHKPNPVKQDIYECGMETLNPGTLSTGTPNQRWSLFNFRYYTFALLFVIFDVETVFLYPWAVQFKQLGLFALVEMVVFIGILVVGWLYAWRKNALEWR